MPAERWVRADRLSQPHTFSRAQRMCTCDPLTPWPPVLGATFADVRLPSFMRTLLRPGCQRSATKGPKTQVCGEHPGEHAGRGLLCFTLSRAADATESVRFRKT